MNEDLIKYIHAHARRGPCCCGKCIDGPSDPENHQPSGHTADMVFFKVSAGDDASAETLKRLITQSGEQGAFASVNLFDGQDHSYIEIGAWIGDQGTALMLMGLGSVLGLWNVLTPEILGLSGEQAKRMAGMGYVTIQAKEAA